MGPNSRSRSAHRPAVLSRNHRALWRHGALLALGSGLLGCGTPGSTSEVPRECGTQLSSEAPDLPEAQPLESITSSIGTLIRADLSALGRELSGRVPVVLASERNRNVGAPGRATYQVTRSGFSFDVADDRLLVSTTINAKIEVCKPFGPLCPVYGRCAPRFGATVSVPLLLDKNYGLGKSRVSLATAKGCVLRPIGLDVTSQLESRARSRIARVRRQIDRSLPPLRRDVATIWEVLQLPIPLSRGVCVKLIPERVIQDSPRIRKKVFETQLAVEGEIRVDGACESGASGGPKRPLPAPVHRPGKVRPEVRLRIPVVIAWPDVSTELSRGLIGQKVDGHVIQKVEARAVRVDSKSELILGVTLSGAHCGVQWYRAHSHFEERSTRLRLTQVEPLSGGELPESLQQALAVLVAKKGQIAIPFDVEAVPGALQSLLARLSEDLPPEIKPELGKGSTEVTRVLPRLEGLVPVVEVRADAQIAVSGPLESKR